MKIISNKNPQIALLTVIVGIAIIAATLGYLSKPKFRPCSEDEKAKLEEVITGVAVSTCDKDGYCRVGLESKSMPIVRYPAIGLKVYPSPYWDRVYYDAECSVKY